MEATTEPPNQLAGEPATPTERVRAFEELLRAADPSIRFVIARLVGGDTDDVLQAAYLKAFRGWHTFRGDASAATWLHRIAYTTAIDHLRQRRRRPVTTDGPDTAVDRHVEDVAAGAIEQLHLASALAAIPAEQRAVLLLVDAQGHSHAGAAEILGVPSGTIASRLHRARIALRALLTIGSET